MGQIHERMAAIMAEANAIGKDSRNQQQNFNFRGIDAVMNHLHPVFARHGVVVMPCVLAERTEERQTKSGGNLIYRVLHIRFDFVAQDGSTVSATVVGEGMDSGDKAANKAMAVGLKYALTQALLLPYDEVDPDAESHDVAPRKSTPAPAAEHAPEPEHDSPPGIGIVTGTLDEVVVKEGTGKNGKPWTRYGAKVDGEVYGTFDKKLGAWLLEHKGKTVSVEYTEDGKFKNLESATVAGREPGEEG